MASPRHSDKIQHSHLLHHSRSRKTELWQKPSYGHQNHVEKQAVERRTDRNPRSGLVGRTAVPCTRQAGRERNEALRRHAAAPACTLSLGHIGLGCERLALVTLTDKICMDIFRKAKIVRLRNNSGKFLIAEDDKLSLSLGRDGTSINAHWTVEYLEGQDFLLWHESNGHGRAISSTVDATKKGSTNSAEKVGLVGRMGAAGKGRVLGTSDDAILLFPAPEWGSTAVG
ncbi:hypothetical protein RJ640_002135 [Escallonia rubra]|uniref:DUF569 domain-containing protein n=1 Tax=Escallonia rubra TaxID=112253 RepID=A0AA88QQ09_9ASTE|nr:hypothetical protein RJ640_002135 [Escallonia rubra]